MAAPGSSGVASMPAVVAPASVGPAATDATSKESKWLMTREQMQNSPSRRDGITPDQELNLRQKAAYLIQDMGQRLRVSQLCINTAIVYMHRFYMFHSFQLFHRTGIAAACLFLGAKVEEQPRKVESIIQMLFASQNLKFPEVGSTTYQEQAQDLVFNENVLLQTLGFDVAVDHPHTHVVKTCHLVKACKDLSQTSYFLASNSLHLTTMCVQYRPTVVACFCIYLACKWSRWEIPQSTEGKYWFHYVDRTVTMEILEQLTNEFLFIYDNSPSRLKKQLNNCKGLGLNSKSPVQPGSSSQMSRPHHSQLSAQPQASASSSSHQRSTVHHHAGKLPHLPHAMGADHQKLPGQSSSSQMLAKPSQPPSSLPASSVASSRHPQQQPHFSAPHRTSSGSNNGMPPMPSSHQLQAYGMASGGSSTGNKSRHPQQPPQQPSQQQPPYNQHLNAHPQMMSGSSGSDARHQQQQQQQLHMHQHQKHRSSKDAPPPKYMDPKMPAPQSTGVMPSGSSTSMAAAASKKGQYPQQQQQQQPSHPNASGQGQSAAGLNHKYDMSKQPVATQPHLANKPSNYPTQPPNYNQSMAGRSDGSHHQGGSHQHQQTSSVHPQHHQLAQKTSHPQQHQLQQQHQHHNHTQSNPYGMSDSNAGAYNRMSTSATGTAPSAAPTNGDDLMAMMMMDTMDSKSKVSSMFNTDYSNMTSQKPKRDPATLSSSSSSSMDMNAGYKNHTFGAANRNAAPSATSSKQHRGDEFSAGQSMSAPPPGSYGLPKPMSQPQQRPATDDNPGDFNKMSKRSHDEYATHDMNASKFRKVEPVVAPDNATNHSYGGMYGAPMAGGTTTTPSVSSLLKSGTTSFNGAGIETNPDLVSSLLKESLCGNDTKYSNNLLTGSGSIGGPSAVDFDTSMLSLDSLLDSKPPLNLLATDTMPPMATMQFMDNNSTVSAAVAATVVASAAAASDSSDHEHRHKSEKKKKKEKSKDKEKKKHKKDRSSRDYRSGSTGTGGSLTASTVGGGGETTAAAPLKIKISKPAHTYS